MNQLSLNLQQGIAAKEEGIERVTNNASLFVSLMREVAIDLSQRNGSVSSDELRVYAAKHGLEPHHRNAWGGIFRGREWHIVGRKQSEIRDNHSREIRIWEWRTA